MRKVQSFPRPTGGTSGNAAMAASGLPFFVTMWKLVESGMFSPHFGQVIVRHQR